LYYGYDVSYAPIIRYCALMGSDDPVSVYLGFYGRFSVFRQRWTDIDLVTVDRGSYLVVTLRSGVLPTMGANGFLIRRDIITKLSIRPYFFDVDLVHELVELGFNKIARVKVAVSHFYALSSGQFIRKTYRRIRDFYLFDQQGLRRFKWKAFDRRRFAKFVLSCIFPYLSIRDAVRGYYNKRDRAWFLNWFLCSLTLLIYGIVEISSGFYLLRQLNHLSGLKKCI